MNINEINSKINGFQKGSIHTLTYTKPLKTRKGVVDSITKVTTMQCRFGVRYDNMASVKEDRASGILPVENQGLAASLRWVDGNIIENTKTGNLMLRVAHANGNKTVTQYFKNGIQVEKMDVEGLCLASEFKTSSSPAPAVMNIGIEKIIDIK